eukprot:3248443-Prymnesium_polylepis.1
MPLATKDFFSCRLQGQRHCGVRGHSAGQMQARLLGHRVRKRDREIASNPVRDDAPHNKTTFLHMEVERIGKDIGGVTARNRAQLEAEAESRWQMLKTRNIQENDVFVTDITSDVSE